jgi:hypothetical protein
MMGLGLLLDELFESSCKGFDLATSIEPTGKGDEAIEIAVGIQHVAIRLDVEMFAPTFDRWVGHGSPSFAVDVMQEIPHCPFADGKVIRLWVSLHYVSLSSGGLLAREPEHR